MQLHFLRFQVPLSLCSNSGAAKKVSSVVNLFRLLSIAWLTDNFELR